MAEADESMDPIDVLSDDERRPAAPNLTGGFFDDDSDLSDVGQDGHDDDRPDVRRVSAPTTAGSDKPYKTSADVVRERQQAGQASGPDPSVRPPALLPADLPSGGRVQGARAPAG